MVCWRRFTGVSQKITKTQTKSTRRILQTWMSWKTGKTSRVANRSSLATSASNAELQTLVNSTKNVILYQKRYVHKVRSNEAKLADLTMAARKLSRSSPSSASMAETGRWHELNGKALHEGKTWGKEGKSMRKVHAVFSARRRRRRPRTRNGDQAARCQRCCRATCARCWSGSFQVKSTWWWAGNRGRSQEYLTDMFDNYLKWIQIKFKYVSNSNLNSNDISS